MNAAFHQGDRRLSRNGTIAEKQALVAFLRSLSGRRPGCEPAVSDLARRHAGRLQLAAAVQQPSNCEPQGHRYSSRAPIVRRRRPDVHNADGLVAGREADRRHAPAKGSHESDRSGVGSGWIVEDSQISRLARSNRTVLFARRPRSGLRPTGGRRDRSARRLRARDRRQPRNPGRHAPRHRHRHGLVSRRTPSGVRQRSQRVQRSLGPSVRAAQARRTG